MFICRSFMVIGLGVFVVFVLMVCLWLFNVVLVGVQLLIVIDVYVVDYLIVIVVKWIGRMFEEKIGGWLCLCQYYFGQFGCEFEVIDMVCFGVIDIICVYFGVLNNVFLLIQGLCLFYVFELVVYMCCVFDGGVVDMVLQGFEYCDLVGLVIYDFGVCCFYNIKYLIVELKDLYGFKLCVVFLDIFIQLMCLFGVNLMLMLLGDIFFGMEMYMIDGVENNMCSFYFSCYFEVVYYWLQSDYLYVLDVLLMLWQSFDVLSLVDCILVIEIVCELVQVMCEQWDVLENMVCQVVVDFGICFNEVDMLVFCKVVDLLLQQYLQQLELVVFICCICDFV